MVSDHTTYIRMPPPTTSHLSSQIHKSDDKCRGESKENSERKVGRRESRKVKVRCNEDNYKREESERAFTL